MGFPTALHIFTRKKKVSAGANGGFLPRKGNAYEDMGSIHIDYHIYKGWQGFEYKKMTTPVRLLRSMGWPFHGKVVILITDYHFCKG